MLYYTICYIIEGYIILYSITLSYIEESTAGTAYRKTMWWSSDKVCLRKHEL